MFRFRANLCLITAIALGMGQMDCSLAGDVPKPVDSTKQGELPPFPQPVKLLGYITKAGSSIILIDIDGQNITLRQGEKKPFRLAGKEVVVWLASPIDFENRSLKIGFPGVYDFVECTLGGKSRQVD